MQLRHVILGVLAAGGIWSASPSVRAAAFDAPDAVPQNTGAAVPPRYEIIDLGTLGGENANAHAINDAGTVVGVATDANGLERPFIWKNGVMQHLGGFDGPDSTEHGIARGISENGFVAGYSMAPLGTTGRIAHAFLWSEELGMIDLRPGASTGSWGWDVNSLGHVVGQGLRGFLWTAETGMVTAAPTGITGGQAEAMNDRGEVVGWGNTPAPNSGMVGWVYDSLAGTHRILGDLGRARAQTRDINESGDIVGYAETPDMTSRPVMWKPDDTIIDLGYMELPGYTQGVANAINDNGWIVGRDANGAATTYPLKGWVWIDGVKYDLLGLIDDPAQREEWLELPHPLDINNRGEIVGIGLPVGATGDAAARAFLMRPILPPEVFTDGFEPD